MSVQPSSSDVWTVRRILNWTAKKFTELDIPTPLLDAQLLLGSVLKMTKVQIYMHFDSPLNDSERASFRNLVKRRMNGEPVAYLLNHKIWHDLDLYVDSNVLIPRPETESLLDFTISLWARCKASPTVIFDFCTGSGCLAIALAKKFPEAKVVAIDISEAALAVAARNTESNKVTNISFMQADLTLPGTFAELSEKWGSPDIVVANPPYVSEQEWQHCDISVKNFEPKIALVAEDSGKKIAREILKNFFSDRPLKSDFCFVMELAEKQPHELCSKDLYSRHLSQLNHVYSYSFPTWELPRNEFFGLKDWEGKERFLCCINGLTEFKTTEDSRENETPLESSPETEEFSD